MKNGENIFLVVIVYILPYNVVILPFDINNKEWKYRTRVLL